MGIATCIALLNNVQSVNDFFIKKCLCNGELQQVRKNFLLSPLSAKELIYSIKKEDPGFDALSAIIKTRREDLKGKEFAEIQRERSGAGYGTMFLYYIYDSKEEKYRVCSHETLESWVIYQENKPIWTSLLFIALIGIVLRMSGHLLSKKT